MAGTPGSKKRLEDYRKYFATASRQGDDSDEDEFGDEFGDEFSDAADTDTDAESDADSDGDADAEADSPPRAPALEAGVRAVDPSRSRIVLIGAPAYDDPQLPDVPQVARNLRDLAAVFTDPKLGGFPPKHCVTVPPDATVAEVGDVLDAAAEEAENLLLFYFAGHGLIGARGELYLALQHTRFRNPAYSGLRFDTIRDTFLHLGTKAKNRAVIIDSCFSGRAIGPTLAASDGALADGLEINGSYTLTSAPENSLALVRDGEAHTAFTGRLLELLREGSTQIGDLISLREIYQHLLTRMRADGLPLPQMRGTATADRLGLVRNMRPAPLVPARLPKEIRALLESGRPPARRAGVEELAELFAGSDPREVLAARLALEQVIARDIKEVADAARRVLASVHSDTAAAPRNVSPLERVAVFLRSAEQTVRSVKSDGDKAYVLAEIAELLSAIDPRQAVRLADKALALAADIDNEGRKAEVLARVAAAVVASDPLRGGALADEAAGLALKFDDPQGGSYFANIISALATDDERNTRVAEHALMLSAEVPGIDDKGPLTAWIAWGMAMAGFEIVGQVTEIAQEAAEQMADREKGAIALAVVALALATTGAGDVASVTDQARGLVDSRSNVVATGSVFGLAALALAKTDRKQAAELAATAEHCAGWIIEQEGPRAPVLAVIGAAVAITGPARAEPFANSITDDYRRANTLVTMARVWLKGSII